MFSLSTSNSIHYPRIDSTSYSPVGMATEEEDVDVDVDSKKLEEIDNDPITIMEDDLTKDKSEVNSNISQSSDNDSITGNGVQPKDQFYLGSPSSMPLQPRSTHTGGNKALKMFQGAAHRTQDSVASRSSMFSIVSLLSRPVIPLGDGELFESLPRGAPTTCTKIQKIKGSMSYVEGVAWLPGGRLVLADKIEGCVKIYSASGDHKYIDRGVHPYGIAANSSGTIVFPDCFGKKKMIRVVSADTGLLFSTWGDDYTWKPRAVSFSNKGHLIITDVHKKKHNVGVYTLDGRQLYQWGKTGIGEKELLNPWAVTVDIFDRVVVADKDNHCVKLFSDRGEYLGRLGSVGRGLGQLIHPRGVCSDSRGNILVCDSGNRRISVFGPDGRFVDNILTKDDGMYTPIGMALDKKSGKLAVAQHNSRDGGFRKLRVYQLDYL